MSTSDNNIQMLVQHLQADIQQLQAELARVEAQNDQLKIDINVLLQKKEDAESRAATAEQTAHETEENLSKLRALAEGEYKSVVAQLFKEPSKKAARQTAASIVIGLVATIFSVQYSLRRSTADSVALKRDLFSALGESASLSREQASQELRNTEARMTQSVQSAFQQVLSKPPSGADIIDLPRNVVLQRTAGLGHDLYFRVTVPNDAQRLDVRLWPLVGNADLYYRFGEPPVPNAPADNVCASTRAATEMDSCYTIAPRAGDWYMRVRGATAGYTTFVIQAVF
ncbi:MAG TPA: hypothetical protein VEK57_01265 [Thermoanaerobaculia bacterium]|nr:hypothetical protein [Thermoanaerobaculia bacterium]